MIKILLLILAVSADGFAAAMGIGAAGIKLPMRSAAVISLTGTIFLTIAVYFADTIGGFIPEKVCRIASSGILVILGVLNLFDGLIKQAAKDKGMDMFCDSTAADSDHSKTISCREAFGLSVVLSADSLVTGISVGLGEMNAAMLVIPAFLIGFITITTGAFIGKKFAKGKINMQWLCGVILIAIAII